MSGDDDKATARLLGDAPLGEARGASEAGWHQIASKVECAKKYQLAHVRGIVTPMHQLPDPLAIGVLFHAGRARWFSKRFRTDEETWQSIADAIAVEAQACVPPCSPDAERQALTLLQLYVDHWSTRPHPTVVAAEYTIGPATLIDGAAFSFRTARLDDVTRYDGALCIGESKTTSADISDVINEYTLHGQTMLQALLWKRAPQGEKMHGPVLGVMLDICKKPSGKRPAAFQRHFLPITETALAWFAKNLVQELKEAASIDWDTDVRRNISNCTRQIGRMRVPCQFREMCMRGKSASIHYTFKNGESLLSWKPEDGKTVAPWE